MTSIRELEERDLELVLAWRSDEDTYRHFRNQDGPLEWDSHRSWFESRDSDREDYIITHGGRRVGTANISSEGEVGILIGEKTLRGEGVASSALELVCSKTSKGKLHAEIHRENTDSKRLFESVGFKMKQLKSQWIEYDYSK